MFAVAWCAIFTNTQRQILLASAGCMLKCIRGLIPQPAVIGTFTFSNFVTICVIVGIHVCHCPLMFVLCTWVESLFSMLTVNQ